jgi:hypothetical protein
MNQAKLNPWEHAMSPDRMLHLDWKHTLGALLVVINWMDVDCITAAQLEPSLSLHSTTSDYFACVIAIMRQVYSLQGCLAGPYKSKHFTFFFAKESKHFT